MEGKVVIMSVVLVSFLVLGQIQVEAQPQRACCPNEDARDSYNRCLGTTPVCAKLAGCVVVGGRLPCPPGFPHNMLESTVNDYCKSGCVSSVCAAIATLQKSDASEVVNGAVEKCSNACSDYCTKGSVITSAVETA